jgi:ubiquinone/menaquinone biosynthesis C-methylase UbiE
MGATEEELESGLDEAIEAELPRALPGAGAAALVFVAAGAVLMLEILAVRLLGPYVGLTLETTTSIIGAALGGIAIGAAVGGYLADRTNTRALIVGLLIVGGLLTLLIVPAVHWLGPGVRGDGNLAALGITIVALVPAAVVLSAVSPATAHLQLHDLRASGTIVGRLSAWATAGALVGTFGSGFVLVPLVSVNVAVLAIGVSLVGVGVVLGASSRLTLPPAFGIGSHLMLPAAAAVVAVTTLGFGVLTAASASPCDAETNYHCAVVERTPGFPGEGYDLILDGDYNSFVDLDDPTNLEYRYTRWIADSLEAKEPGSGAVDGVFVGGGALSLPRWLLAARQGSEALVLEVDGGMIDLVEEKLGFGETEDLEVVIGDARVSMLDVPDHSADVIVGDAFSGLTVPWHLTTEEWVEEVKRVLKPGGLYAMNMIDTAPHDLLKAELATLLAAFADVRMLTEVGPEGEPINGNAVLLASDEQLPRSIRTPFSEATVFQRSEVESFVGDAETLRDDYAPVDQLMTLNRGG